ncbi:glycine cleavage system aminomethyltransferase GcvT [Geochorda subterranea]|uniref:Aminomethyltransferase n=1 Tax=Geochorda subterranea TaxID=3109564 RepID=A0ABZ1BR52_9FIRM|nr:glycine cleavage system aminomethyltransferase GcvT [Limnochorda sp. LNt]WRP14668.1 glycine cleavage system aminomethyltransferase GcvT [Limnochorda sp. LNt]
MPSTGPGQPSHPARTPLSHLHERAGAWMFEFAGWWMPVQYTGIVEEHRAVRERAGLFDLSHMGHLVVEGPDAARALDALLTFGVGSQAVGQARYGVMCLPGGGIVDDLVVYREGPERFRLVVNAACREKDRAWVEQHLAGWQAALADRTGDVALVAVQGPRAQELLVPLTRGLDLEALGFFRFAEAQVAGIRTTVSRTGYTGEDGFELFVEATDAERLWQALMEQGASVGAVPVGLGARDTLRLEARYPLYGHDIDETTTPLEAGLGWVVDFDKPDFIGRHALVQQRAGGPLRRLVGFVLEERGVPREGYALLDPESGRKLGAVTSGTLSPTLQRGIGMGYVAAGAAEPGRLLGVEVRGRSLPARIVKGSFVPIRTRGRTGTRKRPDQATG